MNGLTILSLFLLALLLCLLLVLFVPVCIVVRYRTQSAPKVYLRWLFFKFDLQPPQKGEKKEKKPRKEKKKPMPQKEKPKEAPEQPEVFAEKMGLFIDLIAAAKGGVGFLIRRFRLYKVRLLIVVGGDDAAQTAISYGRVNAAVYSAYALAQNFLNMAAPEIGIRPDFVHEDSEIDLDVRGRLILFFALAAVVRIGAVFLVKTVKRGRQENRKQN